jgi:glycosyltransferase involved in cell wall biosynthesis
MNKTKPKFSVLMANYNNGEYIAQAIKSVINQTFKDWELLIVDDCSNDKSVEIIKKYLGDKRIKFFKNKKNIGYIGTLKRLIKEANADIFGILDSDDVLTYEALGIMYDAHIKNISMGFIYSQYMVCDSNLKPMHGGHCREIPDKSNLNYDCVSHFKTFKKSDYLKTAGYNDDILYAEDLDIVYKMEEVTKLLFINKVLYYYRFLPSSQTHDSKKILTSRMSGTMAKYKAHKRRLNTNIPNLTKQEMSTVFLDGFLQAVKLMDLKKMKFFLLKAIKFSPLNIRGYSILLYRILKFIPYRIYKSIIKQKVIL